MPYGIKPSGDKFVVYNTDTGKPVPGGEHATRADALAHQRALMVNVKDALKNSEVTFFDKKGNPCDPVKAFSVRVEQNGIVAYSGPLYFGGPGSGRHPEGGSKSNLHDQASRAHGKAEAANLKAHQSGRSNTSPEAQHDRLAAVSSSKNALEASKATGDQHLIGRAQNALDSAQKGNFYTASNQHGDSRSMHSSAATTSRLGGPGPARGEPMYNLGRRVK